VYVVDEKNRIQYRRVRPGTLQDDGLRAIEEGLGPDDRVLIGGLTQVRPLEVVQPELMPMPTLDPTAAANPSSRTPAASVPKTSTAAPTPR
jgi:hypothetical protein